MKYIISVLFIGLIISCKTTDLEVVPDEIAYKTNCLLSKIEGYFDVSGKPNYTMEYFYNDKKQIIKEKLFYNDGTNDSSRTTYNIDYNYQYDQNDFLKEVTISGQLYWSYALYQKLDPVAPIRGYIRYKYAGEKMIEEDTYWKFYGNFFYDVANPVTSKKTFEYDTKGDLIKYTDIDSRNDTYYLKNNVVYKAETNYGQILEHEVNAEGQIIVEKLPDNLGINTDIVPSYRFYYDRKGRVIKSEGYANTIRKSYADIEYEEVADPSFTLPKPKNYPKLPFPRGNKNSIYKKRLSYFSNDNGKNFIKNNEYNYTYTKNANNLPTMTQYGITTFDPKTGPQTEIPYYAKNKYEYVNCN
jgi:hypothetical protein